MAESKIINNAARVLKLVSAGTPADQALRESLTQDRHFTAPAERRGISRAVFAYFRWLRWLSPKDSPQKQLIAALDLQARFDKNPASFKPEALAARAVPDWLKDEMDLPKAWLVQLQQEPALWIRAKAGTGAALAGKLSPSSRPRSRPMPSATRASPIFTARRNSRPANSRSRTWRHNSSDSPPRPSRARRGGTPAPAKAARPSTSPTSWPTKA